MTTPLKASNNASMKDYTAGQYRVEVNTGTEQSPVWTEVRGITSYGPKYSQTTEDNTDLGSGNWTSEFPTGNGFMAALKGLVKGTGVGTDKVADPGVQHILDTGKEVGDEGIIQVRHWRTDTLSDQAMYFATCEASLDEGKPPKLQEWSATFKGMGEPDKTFTVPTETTEADDFAVSVGAASAGTFTLTYGGNTTAPIAYNATAATVKAALVALDDGHAAADWTVTGAAPTWTVTTPGGAVTGAASGLTGGTFAVAPA